jgi:hypothetical protein
MTTGALQVSFQLRESTSAMATMAVEDLLAAIDVKRGVSFRV